MIRKRVLVIDLLHMGRISRRKLAHR
jgi:hypothetical protein